MKKPFYPLLLILPCLFVACASTGDPSSAKPTAEQLARSVGYASIEPVDEVLDYRINGFNAINDQALVINSGASQKYLLTLMRYCEGLTTTETIGTTSTLSRLTKFDAVIVPRTPRGRDSCPISEIFRLKDRLEDRSAASQ